MHAYKRRRNNTTLRVVPLKSKMIKSCNVSLCHLHKHVSSDELLVTVFYSDYNFTVTFRTTNLLNTYNEWLFILITLSLNLNQCDCGSFVKFRYRFVNR